MGQIRKLSSSQGFGLPRPRSAAASLSTLVIAFLLLGPTSSFFPSISSITSSTSSPSSSFLFFASAQPTPSDGPRAFSTGSKSNQETQPSLHSHCLRKGGTFTYDPSAAGQEILTSLPYDVRTVYPMLRGLRLKGGSGWNPSILWTEVTIDVFPTEGQSMWSSMLGMGPSTAPAFLVVETPNVTLAQIDAVRSGRSFGRQTLEFLGIMNPPETRGITVSPHGDKHLLFSPVPRSPVLVQCTRETNYKNIVMLVVGFALVTTSGILSGYQATNMLCGALLGVLMGLAVPFFYFFHRHNKVFIGTLTTGAMSYFIVNYWRLLMNMYMFAYICASSLVGIYWLNTAQNQQMLVSVSLGVLGAFMVGNSTAVLKVNVILVIIAGICRLLVGSGDAPFSVVMSQWEKLLMNYWYPYFPRKKQMLSEEEYQRQGKETTERALRELREYYFRSGEWKTRLDPETKARIVNFVGTGDHIFAPGPEGSEKED